jgi:hypothetical protein
MGIYACRNAQKADLNELKPLLDAFESCHNLMGRSIHTGYLHFLKASFEFKKMRPKNTESHLKKAILSNTLPSHYRWIAETWLKCLRGRRVSFPNSELTEIFEHSTKFFFPVDFSWNEEEGRLSSGHDTVLDFKDFPVLKHILTSLICAKTEGLTAPDLFKVAWNESLRTQGWRQKLNNALSRFRWHCRGLPFPLIESTSSGWKISNSFWLCTQKRPNDTLNRQNQILLYSNNRAASAAEIAESLKIPLASVKRMISGLSKSGKLEVIAKGRRVYYRQSASFSGNTIHSDSSQG